MYTPDGSSISHDLENTANIRYSVTDFMFGLPFSVDNSVHIWRQSEKQTALTVFTRMRTFQKKNTHTHPFNGPFSGTTRVSWYQKGKTNLDFTEATDSEWLWHQLGHMQVCTSLQTDNHASTPPLSFLQAGWDGWSDTRTMLILSCLTSAVYSLHVILSS